MIEEKTYECDTINMHTKVEKIEEKTYECDTMNVSYIEVHCVKFIWMWHNQYALLCNSPPKVEKMIEEKTYECETINMHFYATHLLK